MSAVAWQPIKEKPLEENKMKIVIVGGVAGGMSAATRLRRLMEDAEIIVFDKGPYVSFANCGLPFHVSGEIAERSSLLVQTPESLKSRFELDVRPETEVLSIDGEKKEVTVSSHGKTYTESYDKLILSPGAKPFVPPMDGLDEAENVFTLRNIPDLDRIMTKLAGMSAGQATVIGAGFIKVMVVFGTRPEAIKMAPLVLALAKDSERFEPTVVVTAQHREMLDQVLDTFQIVPDYDLNIMGHRQTLTDITVQAMSKLQTIVTEVQPDIMLVHGDTTTTLAASLVAFYNQVKIGHVEAGLRTWNKLSPFPEEVNRQVTDVVADLYFAPTNESKSNLLQEGRAEEDIFITGNTAIDALSFTVDSDYHHEVLDRIGAGNKVILLTMHRRENQGEPMAKVFGMIKDFVAQHPDVEFIYPVHLSPAVKEVAEAILAGVERIHLIEPLNVLDFHNLAARSYFIMSDSGGVQEEAPSLGKPVLVLRDTTERPEGVAAGTLKLVGTDPDLIAREMTSLLTDKEYYQTMSEAKNPYGDGQASKRILEAIAYYFKGAENKPEDFKVEDK